MQIEGAK